MRFLGARVSRGHASIGARKPLARSEELVVEGIGAEVLVYDQRSDRAHCLGPVAAGVWRACDGRTTGARLSTALGLDQPTVVRALEELEECGLLDSPPEARLTRREATAKLAKVGAAAASAPLIYSVVAPTPAAAATQAVCNALGCTNVGNCASGNNCEMAGCHCCNTTSNLHICVVDCSLCTTAVVRSVCNSTTLNSAGCH